MIDEKEFWDKIIAIFFMNFAIYPFAKDLLNEDSSLSNLITLFVPLSMATYFLAGILSMSLFFTILKFLVLVKEKNEEEHKNELKKMERI